jgi:hypothetical protein
LDPDDVSEQLKRQGASIPLVRPGKSTAAFLKTVIFFFLKDKYVVNYLHYGWECLISWLDILSHT